MTEGCTVNTDKSTLSRMIDGYTVKIDRAILLIMTMSLMGDNFNTDGGLY